MNLNKFLLFLVLFFSGLALVSLGFGILIVSSYIVSSVDGSPLLHRTQMIETEYFIDKQICFYLSILHMNTAIFVGIFADIAVATLMLSYFQHTCAMFKIAWYEFYINMTIKNRYKKQYLSI